jgi:AraC family transcriptional regulator
MAPEDEAGTPNEPGAPLDLRGGVPDERLASRDLLVLGGVEVAHTRYLPSEMEVPPLRSHTVNLRLGGTGRVVTRFGGRTHERPLVAGLVEVFTGYEPLQWALEGSVSDNVNVLLGRDFVRRVAAGAGIDAGRTEVVDALNAHDPNAERILMLFLEEVRSEGLGGELYAQSLATALAVHLLRGHSSIGDRDKKELAREPGGLSPRALQRALDYVGDNLSADLSLEGIAGAAHLSPRHFSRLFRSSTGLSPHQYVIRERVERAKRQLLDTELSVGEVALACGFSHQGHLSRHFVRLTGATPHGSDGRRAASSRARGARASEGSPGKARTCSNASVT